MSGNRKRVGLVLGGGSVRGTAHLGVIEVLERGGIHPDCVVGTSVGALIGALYCGGLPVKRMQEMARHLNWLKLLRPAWPGLGLFSTRGMEKLIVQFIGDRNLEDLEIPFAAVATDIVKEEMVILRKGRAAKAVQASCAVPGIFVPQEIEGRLLVDGGLLNNLPVSVARQMGAEYVIAVDLIPEKPQTRQEPQNIMDMILFTIYMVMRHNRDEAGEADCLIRPAIGDFSWARLSRGENLIQRGREAAEAAISQIKMELGFPS